MTFVEIVQGLDTQIILYLYYNAHSPWMDSILCFITKLGDQALAWIIPALVMLFLGRKKPELIKWAFFLLAAVAITAALGHFLVKPLFSRPRPFEALELSILIPPPAGSSFPSSHAAMAFAAAVVAYGANKKLGIFLVVFAILMAFSRVYLAVHYPTDVFGGALFGSAIGALLYWVANKIPAGKAK